MSEVLVAVLGLAPWGPLWQVDSKAPERVCFHLSHLAGAIRARHVNSHVAGQAPPTWARRLYSGQLQHLEGHGSMTGRSSKVIWFVHSLQHSPGPTYFTLISMGKDPLTPPIHLRKFVHKFT